MNPKRIFPKVFAWMFFGLLVSFVTSCFVLTQQNLLLSLYKTGAVWFVLAIELVLVSFFSMRLSKMSTITAKILFFLYSLSTGITLSSILFPYQLSSIVLCFAITSLIFGIFAFLGFYTKVDLTKIGTFCYMALFGILVVTIVNLFLENELLDILLSVVLILVIIVIVAFDIQKIKALESTIMDEEKAAILGAFELYLDFINIFIRIVHLFAKNKD